MKNIFSFILILAVAISFVSAFDLSRKLSFSTDALQSGMTLSKFDALSKTQGNLEESFKGVAKTAAKEAEKGARESAKTAETQAKTMPGADEVEKQIKDKDKNATATE